MESDQQYEVSKLSKSLNSLKKKYDESVSKQDEMQENIKNVKFIVTTVWQATCCGCQVTLSVRQSNFTNGNQTLQMPTILCGWQTYLSDCNYFVD